MVVSQEIDTQTGVILKVKYNQLINKNRSGGQYTYYYLVSALIDNILYFLKIIVSFIKIFFVLFLYSTISNKKVQ